MSVDLGAAPITGPTVADVLDLPALQQGRPVVLAAAESLSRRVRWVHVSELPDVATLLQGGEIILMTGIALPDADPALRAYATALAEAGAAALVIELGRRFSDLPRALVRSCASSELPLIALRNETPFVRITEAAHSLIVDAQGAELRATGEAADVFTSLCTQGKPAAEVVSALARLTGCPAVYEDLARRVVASDPAGMPQQDLLRRWDMRSRSDGEGGFWLAALVEARGQAWGRIVLIPPGPPTPTQGAVLGRAASALALLRLLDPASPERQAHRCLLADLFAGRVSHAEAAARAAALGVPVKGSLLVPLVVEMTGPGRESAGDLVAEAARAAGLRAITGDLSGARVGALLSLLAAGDRENGLLRALTAFAQQVSRVAGGSFQLIGVGPAVRGLAELPRSYREAEYVASAARSDQGAKPFYQMRDIQLHGLLHALGDDSRLHEYVERMLGPILAHDSRHGTSLVAALRAYLADGARNKSAAADAAFLSRQVFYRRLAAIERVLSVDLGSARDCTSLHVAILALDVLKSGPASS